MANLLTVNYTQNVLDQMRCCVCKGYLSHSPIRLLPDGTCVCGSCNPPNLDVQIYRNVPLELLLSQLSFPCRNNEHGCLEKVLFDQATEHESKCVYRSILCPSLKTCDWEGSTTELYNHFSQQHSELVKENAEFKFKIMEDAEGVFITKNENLLFVIKYLYNVYENCLKYDVRYFRNLRKNEGTYKIQLVNDADSECNFNLKTNKCFIFNNSFYDARNAQILKLRKFLELLDNPVMVKVVINLVVVHSGDVSARRQVKLVDYKLLETARCKNCRNYLIPPLFDATVGTICCNCATFLNIKKLPSTNAKLVKIVSEMNYPCQWRNCNFIGNSENIRQHNLSCQFRLYRCRSSDCEAYISLAMAAEHLKNHCNSQYLAPDGVYEIRLEAMYDPMLIWTVQNGTLVLIEHFTRTKPTARRGETKVVGHGLHLFSDLVQCTATVQFEHEHCNLKSEPIILLSGIRQMIDFSKLPTCFKRTDLLSLRITECGW